jgi:hypothetical protein
LNGEGMEGFDLEGREGFDLEGREGFEFVEGIL